MKTKMMATVLAATLALLGTFTSIQSAFAAPPSVGATLKYFVVTGPSSPTNSWSLQNAMSLLDKKGVVGLISTDIGGDPAAVNTPHVLRACDMIYSSYPMWDATNSPMGNFVQEKGKRGAWGIDWTNRTAFLASRIYFNIKSSDAANAMGYSGNIATNTADGQALTFSSTLRGELWDANGNKIATYFNGEDVATHPINRLMALPRFGWYVTDSTGLALDLNYFKNQMPLTNTCSVWDSSTGVGFTNYVTSRCYLTISRDKVVTLSECQRNIPGLYYSILGSPRVELPMSTWTTLVAGVSEGASYLGTYDPNGFFRGMEGGSIILTLARAQAPMPQLLIDNSSVFVSP